MRADFHLHTTASDGRLSPHQLVNLAARLGLDAIAITDHDTVAGIPPALEAARAFPQLLVIPGVEINTDIPNGEVHILGYFLDYTDQELSETLAGLRTSRLERAKTMLQRLDNLGFHISWERVLELAGDAAIGRPHIARAMLEKGYISNLQEAFQKYIGRDGPAYAERYRLTPQGAVALVARVKGLPVLAHPMDVPDVASLLESLVQQGLVGLEAYYPGYSMETTQDLLGLARRHNLIPLGGTDYHPMGNDPEPGSVGPPASAVTRFLQLAKERGRA